MESPAPTADTLEEMGRDKGYDSDYETIYYNPEGLFETRCPCLLWPPGGIEKYLRTWLFGIARHKCQQAYRNRARRQAIAMTFAEERRARA